MLIEKTSEVCKYKECHKVVIHNPYNREEFTMNDINYFYLILKYTKMMNFSNNINNDLDASNNSCLVINTSNTNTTSNTTSNNSPQLSYKNRVYNVFDKMDDLGNYTNANWFFVLNKRQLIKFIIELRDIWFYRINIPNEVKQLICHPSGKPFYHIPENLQNLSSFTEEKISKLVLILMENLILKSYNESNAKLGAFYILMALTLVNNEAREALPLLYQSAIGN
jgi:hypothetical protein